MSGFSTWPEREILASGAFSSGSSLADGLGSVLRRHAGTPVPSSELRDGLRPLVRRAREAELTVEQLLVMAKRAWADLPEVRGAQLPRPEAARRLERIVTTIIELYFER